MNIFQMKTKPHGNERFREFIDEKFVCIGWPGIGNLNQADRDEIRKRLQKEYNYTAHQLGNALGQINSFVNTMKPRDVIFIADKDWAYVGIVGEYIYEQKFDNDKDGACHRRSVEWINHVPINSLESSFQSLLRNRNTICQYPGSVEESKIDKILSKQSNDDNQPLPNKENSSKLDELFLEALNILEEELKSGDPDRRLKAATELLRLKNN